MHRHTSAAAAELDWDGPSASPPSRLGAAGADAVVAALGRDIDSPPAPRPPTSSAVAVGASVAFVAPAGKPATQHVPVASIHTASTAVAAPVSVEFTGEAEATGTAAQQINPTQGSGDSSAAPEQRAESPDPPNPFAAITAWDEAHLAARAPQPSAGAVTAARPLSPAASAAVPVSPIPASHRFSAANFSLPGRRATASVGEIRLVVAAAIAGQSASGRGGIPAAAPGTAAFPRNHSGSSSSTNPSGTSSDGVQWSMGAAGGSRFLQQAAAAAAAETSATGSAPPGPRAGVAGAASSLRQAATAPVDICRMVCRLYICGLPAQLVT